MLHLILQKNLNMKKIDLIFFPIVTANSLKSQNGTLYFRTCEDRAGWHLIPCRISPRSEFFSQAYKNWHIMWGINLGLDWPPLARGSKFHTIHTPTKTTRLPPLDNGRYGPIGLVVIILYCSSRSLQFPVWYFKGIYRTILSKIT